MDYSIFHNQSSGDPTEPNYVKAINEEIDQVRKHDMAIPVVINGDELKTDQCIDGTDPGD